MNLRETLKKFGKDVGINIGAVRLYARQLLGDASYFLPFSHPVYHSHTSSSTATFSHPFCHSNTFPILSWSPSHRRLLLVVGCVVLCCVVSGLATLSGPSSGPCGY